MIYNILKKDTICHLDFRTTYSAEIPNSIYKDKDGYWISDFIHSGNSEDDPKYPVIYKINSDGFRSNHFKNIDGNPSILFGGCSWTFGEGLPEDYTWTKLLTDKIEKEVGIKLDYFNTGYMGSSIDLIIKNTMGFIRKYGKPTYIFLLFPDLARKTIFDENNSQYIKAFPNIHWLSENKKHAQRVYTIEHKRENNIYDNFNFIYLLEDYVKLSGIKLLWSTWGAGDYDLYKQYDFNNLIIEDRVDGKYFSAIHTKDSKDSYYNNINNLPYWGVAKDGAHPGTAWTHFISDLFFQRAKQHEFF